MTFKQYLVESGVLDDILGSFDSDSQESQLPKAPPPTNIPPRIIQAPKQDKFVDYYYGMELKKLLRGEPITIKNIAELYAFDYMAPRDSVTLNLSVDDIAKYKEYDITREQEPERWGKLYSSIKANGVQTAGTIILDRIHNGSNAGSVGVLLGEGNHRLAISIALGLKTMPINFSVKK